MAEGPGAKDRRRLVANAAPLAAAIGVFGVSYGVLARSAGIPGWLVVTMSALVFAGSSQFAVASLLAAGASAPAILLSASLLNLRYLATGASAAPSLGGPRWRRLLAAQLVIDESYALGVAAGPPGKPDRHTMVIGGALMWMAWVLGSSAGVLVGPVIGDPARFGLDAAFPAGFVALLWPMLASRPALRAAIAGAVVALALAPFTPAGVPLAGAAAVGLLLSR